MSYDPPFICRRVKGRRRILGGWWELELECGHTITRRTTEGSKVLQPVCWQCTNEARVTKEYEALGGKG
jgi:hypothetical protein